MHLGRAFERFWLRAETASHRSQGSIPISRLVVSEFADQNGVYGDLCATLYRSLLIGETAGPFHNQA